MDVQAVAQAERTSGKTTWRELLFLLDLARNAPNGASAEVGALYGRSVLAWSIGRRGRGKMLVVDDECRRALFQNVPPDVVCKKGVSWEMAERLPDLAFCFIDADHGQDFARDLAAYAPKIVPGGVIAFHDYEPNRFRVKPMVDEWHEAERWEWLDTVGTLIAFRRPE
jgi:hypothetical protein